MDEFLQQKIAQENFYIHPSIDPKRPELRRKDQNGEIIPSRTFLNLRPWFLTEKLCYFRKSYTTIAMQVA